MNVQPYMIDVEYDETVEGFDGTHAAIKQITLSDPLKRDIDKDGQDVWYTYNHFHREIERTSGRKLQMLQTGFQLKQTEQTNSEATEVYLVPLHEEVDPILLDYDEKHDIWFEKINYRIRTNTETKEQRLVRQAVKITGIVDAGTIKLLVKQKGTNVYEAYVNFLPSSLSKQDYDLMLTDLFRINENLFSGKSNVAIGNKKQRKIEQLETIIAELEGPIYAINNAPQTKLSFEWNKEKHNHSAKFRMRTEIERRMQPGKHKVTVFKPHETTQIKENEMIKTELIRLKKYCEFHAEEKLIEADRKQIQGETNITIEKLGGDLRTKLIKAGALTSSGNIDREKLVDFQGRLLAQQKENKQRLHNLMDEKINEIKRLSESGPTHAASTSTNYAAATVELAITLHSEQFQQDISLANTVKSKYRNRYRKGDITFDSYRYKKHKEPYSTPNIYGDYATIHLHTNQIEEHGRLAKLFEHAKTLLTSQVNNDSLTINIEGKVIYDTKNQNPDNDIIGVKIDRYTLGEVRSYDFIFTTITSATINGQEIDLSITKEAALNKITHLFLMENNKTQFIKLDAQQEKLQHEHYLVENILNTHGTQKEANENVKRYETLAQIIDEWLQLPVFRTIQTTGLVGLQPTQLFLHDPTYLIVWKLMNQIEENIDLSIIPEFGELRFSVKQMHKIYETWTLYKMIDILTEEMKWNMTDKTNAQQYLLNFIKQSNRNNLNNFTIELTRDEWKMIIHHEPYIKLVKQPDDEQKNNQKQPSNYRPDYAFQFFHDGDHIGNAYIDAKYRNYINQATAEDEKTTYKNAEQIWKDDIDDTAISKYGHINAVKPEWNKDTLASFIIHPDITFGMKKEIVGENYHVYYNNELYPNMITGLTEDVHKYGSIYMTPSAIFPFKNWIRMLMEFHFEAYNQCWTCESKNVKEQVKLTISNFPKYYYTCQDCDKFWVKTHCRKGHTIIKYVNTYHKRADRKDRWHIVCPTCEDKFEDEGQRFRQETTGKTTTDHTENDTAFNEEQPEKILMMEDELPM